ASGRAPAWSRWPSSAPARQSSPVLNWANESKQVRGLVQAAAHVDAEAKLPKFCGRTLVMRAAEEPAAVNMAAPAFGRKAVLYATCFSNYNNPEIGMAARRVL